MLTDINISIKQKRGRKSKKELQAIQEQKNLECIINENKNIITNNSNQEIDFSFQEKIITNSNNDIINTSIHLLDTNEENTVVKPPPKKRGRKPKGGKIIQQITPLTNVKEEKANVILHLKCSLKDLQEQTHNNFNMFNVSNEQL